LGLLIGGVLGLLSCTRPAPPRLADALTAPGGSRARVAALLHVAISGLEVERERAWFAAGLIECELGSPAAATTAFRRSHPGAGLAALAARRLEESLAASAPPASTWLAAASSSWLDPVAATRLRLRCAEVAAGQGRWQEVDVCLPPVDGLTREQRRRAVVVQARCPGAAGEAARARLVVEFPAAAEAQGLAVEALSRSLAPPQLAVQAQGWLDAGRPQRALESGRRAGATASLVTARAALRLRRATQALGLIRGGTAEAWVERADAYRLVGWAAARGQRGRPFADALRAAEWGLTLPGAEPETTARLHLLAAEALIELGRFAEALPHLRAEMVQALPRYDWVCRRWSFLQGRRGQTPLPGGEGLPGSTRVRRLAAYWQAVGRAQAGDRSGLQTLADSGFPDLVAQWASQSLGRSGVAFAFPATKVDAPRPPPWADDLLTLGRTADIAVAWRADLETGRAPAAEWLGLVALAQLAPLDAIPLLVRGEPRLLAGPWDGLPAALVEQYLPLPWRQEVEVAARAAGVPPWVLAGLVRQESAWNPRARSAADALGLAQVLPAVGREAGSRLGLRVQTTSDLFDPATNLAIGARLLGDWRRAFGGAWEPAFASYNAGERRVRELWDETGRRGGPLFVEAFELPETHDYVHRVVLLAEGYRALYWPEGKPYPWT